MHKTNVTVVVIMRVIVLEDWNWWWC